MTTPTEARKLAEYRGHEHPATHIRDALRDLADQVEALTAERNYARAKADRMLSILLGIHQLLDPPINEVDGIKYKFVNPNAAEVLHKLSEKIRAIPDAIDADIAKGTA